MADPRFFENLGPFTLAQICEKIGSMLPADADGSKTISDLADLAGASPAHITFFSGNRLLREAFAGSGAGACLIPLSSSAQAGKVSQSGMTLLEAASVQHAFAMVARMFYPESSQPLGSQTDAISPDARIGAGTRIAPGVAIGSGAEIGEGTRIAPGVVIGPGVAIGRNCEIGANATILHAYIGDRVVILPGAHIGQPGFGFTPSSTGYIKMPQLGRVIIQDDCEIGSATTIDRGTELRDRGPGRPGRQRGAGGRRDTGRAGGAGRSHPRRRRRQDGRAVRHRLAHCPARRGRLWRGSGETCKRMGAGDSRRHQTGKAPHAGRK